MEDAAKRYSSFLNMCHSHQTLNNTNNIPSTSQTIDCIILSEKLGIPTSITYSYHSNNNAVSNLKTQTNSAQVQLIQTEDKEQTLEHSMQVDFSVIGDEDQKSVEYEEIYMFSPPQITNLNSYFDYHPIQPKGDIISVLAGIQKKLHTMKKYLNSYYQSNKTDW